jgi:hypothetical protein
MTNRDQEPGPFNRPGESVGSAEGEPVALRDEPVLHEAPIGPAEEPWVGPHGELHADSRERAAIAGLLALFFFLTGLVLLLWTISKRTPGFTGRAALESGAPIEATV